MLTHAPPQIQQIIPFLVSSIIRLCLNNVISSEGTEREISVGQSRNFSLSLKPEIR